MSFKVINFKVILYAVLIKLKKLLNKKYDPYQPLPTGLYLNPSNIISEAYKSISLDLSFSKNKLDPLKWQKKARRKLADLSGYKSSRKIPKVSKIFHEIKLSDSISRKKIYLRISPKCDIPINLIFKKPYKHNSKVFIFLAGSTSGAHIGWGEAKVPIDHQRIFIGADIAIQAAEKGYLAVTFEQAGYGERLEKKLKKKSNDRTIDFANHLLLLGKSLEGNGASEISYVIDWLCSKNNKLHISKKDIYLYGHSAGGTLAQFTAALDKRIKGTLASGSVGTILDTIGTRGCGSGSGIIPGFLNYFDTKDIIGLIAPRFFIALHGDKDHIYPYKGAKKVIDAAKSFYKKLNASDKIISIKVKGKHQYYNKESWKAWDKFIGL